MNTHGDLTATRWLEHTVPVLLLLLLAHFASHAKAICVYAFFFVVLTRCDAYLRARVGKTKRGDDGGGDTAGGTAGGGADASPAGAAVALTVVLLSHLTLLRTMYPTDAFWGRVFLFTLPSGDGADDPAAWGFARWGTVRGAFVRSSRRAFISPRDDTSSRVLISHSRRIRFADALCARFTLTTHAFVPYLVRFDTCTYAQPITD